MHWLIPTDGKSAFGALESRSLRLAREFLLRGHRVTFMWYEVNCCHELRA